VGIILVIALLTLPTVIAKIFTENFYKISMLSVIVAIIFSFVGLIISYFSNLPSGATIIITLGIMFLLFILGKKFLNISK